MAKIAVSVLIDELAGRLGYLDLANASMRAAMLLALNTSDQWLAQQGSMLYLNVFQDLAVANGLSQIAVPANVDVSKTITLGRPNNGGIVPVVPSDKFREEPIDTYGVWSNTQPVLATIGTPGDGTFIFIFSPGNSTGSTITYKLNAQMIPPALTDGAGFASVPEGYERTVLMRQAEMHEKELAKMPISAREQEEHAFALQNFYGSFRTSREMPMPDQDQKARRASQQLSDGRGA